MKLEKIITLANEPVKLRFLAMERSLRATGNTLPLLVIPYDDRTFDLPPNANWWKTDLADWLIKEKAHRTMFKYQCLTTTNFQFVDSDVVFLKDPARVLAKEEGFITSCGHWRDPGETVTPESYEILRAKSTVWQKDIFNTGQFACDKALFTEQELKTTCLDPRYIKTCLHHEYHEQPGVVLLANLSGVPIRNLTMPPTCMESTWAGDYDGIENYEVYWRDENRKPYLIHWAGCDMWLPRSIDNLFIHYFTGAELKAWQEEVAAKKVRELEIRGSLRHRMRGIFHGAKAFAGTIKG